MIDELALVFGGRIVAAEDVYPATLEYRMYQIQTTHNRYEAIAVILDGEREVGRVFGKDYHQAIKRAKEWIDEQEEVPEEYDLHIAPANI